MLCIDSMFVCMHASSLQYYLLICVKTLAYSLHADRGEELIWLMTAVVLIRVHTKATCGELYTHLNIAHMLQRDIHNLSNKWSAKPTVTCKQLYDFKVQLLSQHVTTINAWTHPIHIPLSLFPSFILYLCLIMFVTCLLYMIIVCSLFYFW